MKHTAGLGIAALALSLGCGTVPEPTVEGSSQPIINGADSMDKQFPTVTGLLLDAYGVDQMNPNPLMPKCVRGLGACTGTLIREDVILTASHCVVNLLKQFKDPSCQKDPDPPKYSFEVDLIGAARGMRVTATAKAVAHPMFAPTTTCMGAPTVDRWNDVALVFLKDPIKGVPLQKIAKPGESDTLLKEGSKVRIVGYGKSKVDDDMSAGTQRWGTATLVKVGQYEIQAGQMGEQQACQGDSGGPVFANPDGPPEDMVQIGVASRLRTAKCPSILDIFNPPKCENGVFYTRVDAFYDWIQQTIEKERPATGSEDMRKPDAPDMAQPPVDSPDLASGEDPNQPPPEDKGCKCSVGGRGSAPVTPLLLFGAVLLGRLRRRRR